MSFVRFDSVFQRGENFIRQAFYFKCDGEIIGTHIFNMRMLWHSIISACAYLCGFSNIHLLLSYIERLYYNVFKKYWLWRTRFDAFAGVIISVNFAHVRHLHIFGVRVIPRCWVTHHCFHFHLFGSFFGVLGSNFLRCTRNIAKRDYWLRYVCLSCPSVRPHETTRLLLDGFSWNLVYEYFLKICLEFGFY
jgi:hypothetical protein